MNRGFLGEEEVGSVKRQITVNLVGGNLVIALNTVLAAGVHQYLGAENVGGEEDFGVLDRAVNMAFRREVDDDIGMLLLKELVYRLSVGNAFLDKAEIRVVHHGSQG